LTTSGDIIQLSDLLPIERRLIFTFCREHDGKLYLTACEISNSDFTNRSVFDPAVPAFEGLESSIVMAISEQLLQVRDTATISAPDFAIELPNLMLGNAHIAVSPLGGGRQKVVFRLNKFFGCINDAFCEDFGIEGRLRNEIEDTVSDLVSNLSLPLINYLETMNHDHASPEDQAVRTCEMLTDQAFDIGHRLAMLRRFVDRASIPTKKNALS
jgi:hypothetical protein